MPDDYEYVDGIEVLSKLCDERGLEHWDSEAMACDTHIFFDKAGNPHECWEASSGMVNVVIAMTPEQAVELGRGECHDKNGFDPELGFECTVCGAMVDTYMVTPMEMGHVRQFAYCPFCGRRVVEVGE